MNVYFLVADTLGFTINSGEVMKEKSQENVAFLIFRNKITVT